MSVIEEYISDLNSEDERKRAFAAEDIAYEGLNEGIVPLVDRLQMEDSRFVKEAIVNALKTMNGTELVASVIPLLRCDDAFIRNAGIDILAAQGEDSYEPIRLLIFDPDKDVRKFAIDVLLQVGNKSAQDLIAETLDDVDINIVITAVEYLGRLESHDHTARINTLLKTTSNLLLRCACLETLAVIGDNESITCVAEVYPHSHLISPLELYSYLKFIACQGTEQDLPLIIALMKDKGQLMHKEIINALGGILYRSKLDMLMDDWLAALKDYIDSGINDINKYELLVMLGAFKNEAIFPLLVEHSNSDIKLVRQGAVEGLGRYGKEDARPVLVRLKDLVEDDEILEAIERSLELINR